MTSYPDSMCGSCSLACRCAGRGKASSKRNHTASNTVLNDQEKKNKISLREKCPEKGQVAFKSKNQRGSQTLIVPGFLGRDLSFEKDSRSE